MQPINAPLLETEHGDHSFGVYYWLADGGLFARFTADDVSSFALFHRYFVCWLKLPYQIYYLFIYLLLI